MTVSEAASEVLQDKHFYDNTRGGLTVSGGELLSQTRFALSLIEKCAACGIKSCIDTSGYGSFDDLLTLVNAEGLEAVLYDIKSIDDDVHKRYTGVGSRMILDNLKKLAAEKPAHVEIHARLPLIRDINDGISHAEAAASLLASLGIRKATLLPYHNLGISKARNVGMDIREFSPPASEKTEKLSAVYNSAGIDTAILGKESADEND